MVNLFRKNEYNRKNEKGFALLFTVVIVTAVSVITAGLTNAVYKQSILSSLTKDSQSSFYQADTASECAFYADLKEVSYTDSTFLEDHASIPWQCGGMNLISNRTDEFGSYTLLPEFDYGNGDGEDPCFRIYVEKKDNNTMIKARGYNICEKTNKRTVEREIEINYTDYLGE